MASAEHCLYCFEALSASLEKRQPMTLSQVQSSWAEYSKGAELSEAEDDEEEDDKAAKKNSLKHALKNPTLDRLGRPESGSSTPSSSSSSSLEPSTAVTTPASSDTSLGVAPQSSKRAVEIEESPLFVTWNTVSSRSSTHSLRGCIGTFESLPLSSGLSSYALTSALSDHRFSPIALSELPSLEVSVTLLTDFETADDAMDWELGVHGLRISFYARNRRFGACYLPDVAVEQGWDKEETVVSLMRKAGWGGKKEKWMEVNDMRVVRFQGLAESLGYEDFRRWREWVEAKK
jgi:uncharacterized protein (TIGR00296 family)